MFCHATLTFYWNPQVTSPTDRSRSLSAKITSDFWKRTKKLKLLAVTPSPTWVLEFDSLLASPDISFCWEPGLVWPCLQRKFRCGNVYNSMIRKETVCWLNRSPVIILISPIYLVKGFTTKKDGGSVWRWWSFHQFKVPTVSRGANCGVLFEPRKWPGQ